MEETSRICPWCSTSIPAGASACPKCGATVDAGHDDRATDEEAILPPSEAVRLEMRKMQLEAQIENAGRSVMNPTGDVARNVGEPSREALEAYDAGLLDTTGPAGETDIAERVKVWEEEERR
jgi:hypothetical protein